MAPAECHGGAVADLAERSGMLVRAGGLEGWILMVKGRLAVEIMYLPRRRAREEAADCGMKPERGRARGHGLAGSHTLVMWTRCVQVAGGI